MLWYMYRPQGKANILTFHPQARDVLMSAGYDGKIFIWDLSNHSIAMEMDSLSQPVCSKQLYTTVCYFYVMLAICCFMESRWNVPCYSC